jgi:hypothetical protein
MEDEDDFWAGIFESDPAILRSKAGNFDSDADFSQPRIRAVWLANVFLIAESHFPTHVQVYLRLEIWLPRPYMTGSSTLQIPINSCLSILTILLP